MPRPYLEKSDHLVDRYGRPINYLRLSITDLCNLRCFYCMPPGGVSKLPHTEILRYEEILEVIRAAVSLGVTKVRVTGGEPLIKRGAVKIIREIASMPSITTVGLTTNGTRLEKYVDVLKQAGLDRINVSLDSLNPETYRTMTRCGDIDHVLRGIDAALQRDFPLKINVVLVRGVNDGEAVDFVKFSRDKNVELRFIERMSFEDGDPYVSEEEVISALREHFHLEELPVDSQSAHVRLFDCSGTRVGFISPRSKPFCSGCNKLRLMPNGRLKACLASPLHVDIRDVLRRRHTMRDVQAAIRAAVALKPESGPWDTRAEMWRVGG